MTLEEAQQLAVDRGAWRREFNSGSQAQTAFCDGVTVVTVVTYFPIKVRETRSVTNKGKPDNNIM